jgi:hypothetical protein
LEECSTFLQIGQKETRKQYANWTGFFIFRRNFHVAGVIFTATPIAATRGRADSIVGRWVTDSAEQDVVAKQTECVQGWVYLLPSAKSLIALSGGFVGAFGRSRLAEKL